MNLYQYAFTGDPHALLRGWDEAMNELGRDELLLNVVTSHETGITVLDVCPSDADFEGWINGDDWRRVKAAMGGEVAVRKLGQVRNAIAREGVVEIVQAAHVH